MIVSIHQPAYLPWLGYFDRIAKSDTFIFLDNVQFERNSYTNRNQIKTPRGPIWLTVPVRLDAHFDKAVSQIAIDDTQEWRRKHLRSIQQNYSGTPEFGRKFTRLAASFQITTNKLADFCRGQLDFWLTELGIATPVLRASELPVAGRKSSLVLNLCKQVGATTYLSGPFGRRYLEEPEFCKAGIAIEYHDFVHPTYPQKYGNFVPAMAIVDYWLNSSEPELFRGAK